MTWMIDLAVVIVIVLAIMLLPEDSLTLPVFCVLKLGTLLLRHLAVGLGLVFHRLQVILPFFKAPGFLRRERARLSTLIDALLLIDLALVEFRCGS